MVLADSVLITAINPHVTSVDPGACQPGTCYPIDPAARIRQSGDPQEVAVLSVPGGRRTSPLASWCGKNWQKTGLGVAFA
jgi:hypothetical protein